MVFDVFKYIDIPIIEPYAHHGETQTIDIYAPICVLPVESTSSPRKIVKTRFMPSLYFFIAKATLLDDIFNRTFDTSVAKRISIEVNFSTCDSFTVEQFIPAHCFHIALVYYQRLVHPGFGERIFRNATPDVIVRGGLSRTLLAVIVKPLILFKLLDYYGRVLREKFIKLIPSSRARTTGQIT